MANKHYIYQDANPKSQTLGEFKEYSIPSSCIPTCPPTLPEPVWENMFNSGTTRFLTFWDPAYVINAYTNPSVKIDCGNSREINLVTPWGSITDLNYSFYGFPTEEPKFKKNNTQAQKNEGFSWIGYRETGLGNYVYGRYVVTYDNRYQKVLTFPHSTISEIYKNAAWVRVLDNNTYKVLVDGGTGDNDNIIKHTDTETDLWYPLVFNTGDASPYFVLVVGKNDDVSLWKEYTYSTSSLLYTPLNTRGFIIGGGRNLMVTGDCDTQNITKQFHYDQEAEKYYTYIEANKWINDDDGVLNIQIQNHYETINQEFSKSEIWNGSPKKIYFDADSVNNEVFILLHYSTKKCISIETKEINNTLGFYLTF